VFERRFKRQFPFDMTAIWKLIGKRYPMLLLASGNLSLREKSAVIDKYIRDTIDRNANWDKVCFDLFVENGVCRKDQKAAFFLFNFMRNPHLRSGKAKVRMSFSLQTFLKTKKGSFFRKRRIGE
jgi:hypothetical protein